MQPFRCGRSLNVVKSRFLNSLRAFGKPLRKPGIGLDPAVAQFVRDRSESSFRKLYRAHAPIVTGLCAKMLSGTPHRAEDACQETWLRAVRSIERFEGKSRFSTWLCGIAVNVVHELSRGQESALVVSFDGFESDEEKPIEAEYDAAELGDALARLPTGFRAAVILHDVQGFTHEEIGEILGISSGTAKSQLSRARSRLRALLTNDSDQRTRHPT